MILRGSGPVLLRNPIFFRYYRGGLDPMSPLYYKTVRQARSRQVHERDNNVFSSIMVLENIMVSIISKARLGMSVTTQGGSGRQFVTGL